MYGCGLHYGQTFQTLSKNHDDSNVIHNAKKKVIIGLKKLVLA